MSSQDIWEWWVQHHDDIPHDIHRYVLEEDDTEFMIGYKNIVELGIDPDTQVLISSGKIAKADPVAKDIAMRKGLMYGARKILPRAIPYLGWGLLAKDIYDFFKD